MKKIIYSVLLILAFVVASRAHDAQAADVHMTAQFKRYSPGYYSNTSAKFDVILSEYMLNENYQIYFRYGFESTAEGKTTAWMYEQEVPMKYDHEIESWTLTFEQIVHARTSSISLTAIDYVFRVVGQNGTSYFIKGSPTTMGYYRSEYDLYDAPFEWSATEYLKIGIVDKD